MLLPSCDVQINILDLDKYEKLYILGLNLSLFSKNDTRENFRIYLVLIFWSKELKNGG